MRKRPLTSNEGQSRDIVDVEGVGGLAVKEIKYVSISDYIVCSKFEAFSTFALQLITSFVFPRSKVDLTKYIEEHLFEFDNAYSDEADN